MTSTPANRTSIAKPAHLAAIAEAGRKPFFIFRVDDRGNVWGDSVSIKGVLSFPTERAATAALKAIGYTITCDSGPCFDGRRIDADLHPAPL